MFKSVLIGLGLAASLACAPLAAKADPLFTYTRSIVPPDAHSIPAIWGLAIDPTTHNFVVTDSTHSVFIYSSSGAFVRSFSSGGGSNANDTPLGQPTGVTLDPSNGDILVADDGLSRIQIYTATGTYVATLAGGGSGNANDTPLLAPQGVAVDPTSGHIMVADTLHNRVQIYDNTRTYVGTIVGNGGAFNQPGGVGVDPVTHNILVADTQNGRVQVFDSTGAFIMTIAGGATSDPTDMALQQPIGVAVQPGTGDIFVTDEVLNRVQIYSPTGQFLFSISSHSVDGALFGPITSAFDPATPSNVFVTSINFAAFEASGAFNGEIQEFGPPPIPSLTDWALVALAVLLAALGYLITRRRPDILAE